MESPAGRRSSATPAITRVRQLFVDDDHHYGCAETTFIALKEAFGLPDAADASAAMALNGGVAWSGGVCGAVSGAALAVGQLVAARVPDHPTGKRLAREIVAGLMDDFEAEFGSVECRTLLGRDIRTPEAHAAFIDSGIWRTVCLRQIELAVGRLATLADDSRIPAAPASAALGGGGQEQDDGPEHRHEAG
jgi:C_GCAxxG_C_C family probable redox protein